MKITHLTSVHEPTDNRIFKMCKWIARTGRQVSYIVPANKDAFVEDVAIKSVPLVSTRWKRMVWTTWRVYRGAVRERADIYQFHDPELMPAGLALRFLNQAEVIYDVHENVPAQILSKDYIPRRLRNFVSAGYDRLERYCARRLSAIVTANEDINERFRDSNDWVVAIHNYANNDEFRSVPETGDSRYKCGVVFHCAASDRTAYPTVLRALELLPKDLPIKLVVTPSPTEWSPCAAASEAGTAAECVQRAPCRQIEVLPWLPREELAKVYSHCAVSIVLYKESQNHSSIRSNRFYESLAAAAPVIAPDFPEWRAIVDSIRCGLTVNPNDPQAIADALQYLLTHPREAAAMGNRGRCAFLKEFDWALESDKLLKLYDALLLARKNAEGIVVTTHL